MVWTPVLREDIRKRLPSRRAVILAKHGGPDDVNVKAVAVELIENAFLHHTGT